MNDELYQGIVNALKGNTNITALIGSGAQARIFRQQVPEGTVYPYCVYALAHPGSDTRYYGLGGRDREVVVVVMFMDVNTNPNYDRNVVLLDKYAETALTNNVTATGLVTFLRESDMPDGPHDELALGTVEYSSAGSIYRAYFQVS